MSTDKATDTATDKVTEKATDTVTDITNTNTNTNTNTSSTSADTTNHTSVAELQACLPDLAEELFKRIEANLSLDNIEIEMRLCRFALPKASGAGEKKPVRFLPRHVTKGKINTSVWERDFRAIEKFVMESKVSDGCEPRKALTEDIADKDTRYTYSIGEDNKRTLQCCVTKIKKCVRDIQINWKGYDLRLSISTETDEEPKYSEGTFPKGMARRKQRTSVENDGFRYDLTEVTVGNRKSFEVEVEGLLTDGAKVVVTPAWLAELLGRMTELASLPFTSGASVHKRPREEE